MQRLVQTAAVFVGLHDDHELVTGKSVVAGDVGVIAVVARIRTQLRCAGVQITHFEVHHHHTATQGHQQRQGDDRRGPRTFGEAVEAVPEVPEQAPIFCARLIFGDGNTRGFFTDAQVRQRHRNQQ
ncbi:hypothetical protein D3C84_946540 [compost metagenome]